MPGKLEAALSSFKDFREFVPDFLAPELREIKVSQKVLETAVAELRAEMKAGFDRIDRRMETYEDVQKLKEEMAEIRGERRARQKEPAA